MPPAVHNILSATLPLPVVAILLLQVVAVTWWASGQFLELDARVAALERQERLVADHASRIIVLEQSYIVVREGIAEIKTLLRRDARQEHNAAQ